MDEYIFEHDGKHYRFGTNYDGEGFFVWGYIPGQLSPQWCQITGTGQFSVAKIKHSKNKRAKIKKYAETWDWFENVSSVSPMDYQI